MDFYLDFARELEKSHSPEVTLQEMVERIKGAIEQASARVALAEGTALLAAIHDYQNPQAIQTLSAFRDIKEGVELLLAALDADIDLEEHMWEERSGAQYDECPEDQPQESLSRRFLDFEHVETWGKARWTAFTAQIDTVIDIATTSPTGLDSMSHLLIEIKSAFGRMSVDSQEQALIAADRLVLAIREGMERAMDTMQDRYQFGLIADLGDWDGEDDPPERFAEEPPDVDEATAFFTSELQPYLDLSGWGNWGEEDWAVFDQAIANAQAAAVAEPADTAPAMHLFLEIRQNIETLTLHRRFAIGNLADDLMEAIKQGMAQDLFRIQKKCPAVPVPIGPVPSKSQAQQDPPPATDGGRGHWKRGKVGRETVELNFDQIADWGLSEWAGLKIEADKLMAAAELTTEILGPPGQMLEDIRAHVEHIPPLYKKEVAQMAVKLERAISGKVSETLSEILQSDG